MTHPIARTKILSCYHEVKALARGDMPAPRTVELFVTTRCNHNCAGCHTKELRRGRARHLDPARAADLLAEWRALGVQGLEISGVGEPLLYPHLEALLQHAMYLGFSVGLITNGSMLHTADTGLLVRAARFIRVAFDAADRDTYHRIHGADDLDTVVRNVQDLLCARGREKSAATIGLKALVSRHNADRIAHIATRAADLGADYIQFKALRNSSASLALKQCETAHREILKLKNKLESKTFKVLGGLGREKLAQPCYLSPLHPVVDPAAALFVCPYYSHHPKSHRIGSLKSKSFASLWGSPAHFRKIKNIDPRICNRFDCPLIPYNNFAARAILDDDMHLSIV